LFLVLLALPTLAYGATADLAFRTFPDVTLPATSGILLGVQFVNDGPDAATNVTMSLAFDGPGAVSCARTSTRATLAPHETFSVSCSIDALNTGGTLTLTATATSDTSDPDLSNNTTTRRITWVDTPDLAVSAFVSANGLIDPATPTAFTIRYGNSGTSDATNVVIEAELPSELTVKDLPSICSAAGGTVRCSVGTVTATPRHPLEQTLAFTIVPPDDRSGRTFPVRLTISGAEPELSTSNNQLQTSLTLVRFFRVDNTSDSGAGSLRDAIQSANASCTDGFPCKIATRLADDVTPVIAPKSELPVITARNTIVESPLTRRVFLDGSAQNGGSGWTFDACEFTLTGWAIGHFADSGVHVLPKDCTVLRQGFNQIRDNLIGVDATGFEARPNGIGIAGSGPLTIANNTISGNRRSGIFYLAATNHDAVTIQNNVIGLDGRFLPLGNGASGIFVGAAADISGNFVAFNRQFGIAVARGPFNVDIHPNVMFGNGNMAIDLGLDGPSEEPLQIQSAHYDASTNTTVITFTQQDNVSTFGPTLQFYAANAPHSPGRGEAQYYLGTIPQSPRLVANPPRTFVAQGDWRGKWISATLTTNLFHGFAAGATPLAEFPETSSSTSELCTAVQVQ